MSCRSQKVVMLRTVVGVHMCGRGREAGFGSPVKGVLYLTQTSLLSRRRSMASLNDLNEGMRGKWWFLAHRD